MSATRIIFEPKQQGATRSYNFDFTAFLAASETLSSPVVTASVWTGVDANPSVIVSGSGTVSSGLVAQKFTAGVVGVIYLVKCSVNTSNGQVLTQTAFLAVIPDSL